MGIERTDLIEETEEEKAEKAELDALRSKAHADELAKVRAEAELETTKKFIQSQAAPVPQQTQQFSEEQWVALETQTGLSRNAIMASGQLANQIYDTKSKDVLERLKKAEERAAAAEAKASGWERKQGSKETLGDFFKKNQAYSAYEKEVNEFVDLFPESERSDPDKLNKILDKAKSYVKGVVKAKGEMKNGSSGRLGQEEAVEENSSESIDYTGLENISERRLIADIHNEFNSREDKDLLKKYSSHGGLGVSYDSSDEFKEGDRRILRGGSFGGKSGEK